jgi:hypothetical protein
MSDSTINSKQTKNAGGTMNVHKKLMQARIKLQAAKLSKTGQNKFAGYQYFELGDFLPTVQQIFSDLGLCGTVSYTADTAKLTITDTDGGGEIVITSPMGSAALKGCHEVQNIGAVETYQRRYLWVTAMEIVEHDALDATTGKDAPASAKPVTKDVWDSLDPEAQKWLQGIADCVRAELDKNGPEAAIALIKEQGLDSDHAVALWSRFDSRERSQLKKKAA